MITSALVGQIIRSGRLMQLIFFLMICVMTYISYTYGKQGKRWEIRPLEGLDATYEGIGRAAEMGRPIMVLPGISNLGDPQTLAGLTVLGEVAQQSAEIGVKPVTSASNTGVVAAAEAIVRSSFTAAGKPELYSPGDYVQWFGGDQFAYAVGAAGQIMNEKPAVIVYCGYFLFDVIVDGETGQRVGAVQIGGTIGSMNMVALFCDYLLIGEELYAASASITRDPMATATLVGQDWIKFTTLIILILGSLFSIIGSDLFVKLLGM